VTVTWAAPFWRVSVIGENGRTYTYEEPSYQEAADAVAAAMRDLTRELREAVADLRSVQAD